MSNLCRRAWHALCAVAPGGVASASVTDDDTGERPTRHRGLLEPGQGWLRWATDTAWSAGSYLDPPEPYGIAPPLRRLWWAIRYCARWPFDMRQEDRRRHRAW